jgi:hypothetical protein
MMFLSHRHRMRHLLSFSLSCLSYACRWRICRLILCRLALVVVVVVLVVLIGSLVLFCWSWSQAWVPVQGTVQAGVGASSRDIRLKTSFTV